MTPVFSVIAGVLILIGATFTLLAAIGVLRLPDVYTRMHSASKAGTLGSGLALIALAVDAAELAIVARVLAGIAFFLLTAPLSAHLLSRAAYLSGHKPTPKTAPDALAARLADERRLDEAEPEQ